MEMKFKAERSSSKILKKKKKKEKETRGDDVRERGAERRERERGAEREREGGEEQFVWVSCWRMRWE